MRRALRAETIGAVLRSIVSLVIWATAVLMILETLGVNLAAIGVGASIIGVAIGFGSQSLVRDFLSGMFMLIEDQYGVGDVIDTGVATGTVEGVSLRTTRLRDVEGVGVAHPQRRDPPGRQQEPAVVARGARRPRRVRRRHRARRPT